MLILETGDRFVDASIDWVERNYCEYPNIPKTSITSTETDDDNITRLLDLYLPSDELSGHHTPVSVDEFVVQILHPRDDRAQEQNFMDAKIAEVEGLNKREIWTVEKVQQMSENAVVMRGSGGRGGGRRRGCGNTMQKDESMIHRPRI